jgi:CO/xanthine dehydrogenase Mo-binding subunit
MAFQEEMKKKLKGLSKFTSDIVIKNCFYGYIIGSPVPKGTFTIKSIPKLSHGYYCLTHKDIPGDNRLSLYSESMPFLAEKELHYPGEPICLLCGPNQSELAKIASHIEIDYKEEKPCLAIEKAEAKNIIQKEYIYKGEVEKTFAQCAKIIEGEFHTNYEECQFIEPQTAIAYWENKKLMVYCTTKNLFYTRDSIALFLNIPKSQANVIVPDFVEDQGEKQILPTLLAAYAALLSSLAGKPVKISYENTVKRYPCIIRHKTALDETHLPVGAKIEILLDAGAFNISYPDIFKRALFAACGAYELENLELAAFFVRTNKVPFTRFLDTGALEAFFAIELHISNMARVWELDPYTMRIKLLERALTKKNKKTDPLLSVKEILSDAVDRSDFLRKYSAYEALLKRKSHTEELNLPMRGIGLSLVFYGFDFIDEFIKTSKHSLKLTLNKKNQLTIYSSSIEADQGIKQVFALIASRILGINTHKISFESQTTQNIPDSGPLTETRVITHIGKLVEQGSNALLLKMKKGSYPITVIKSHTPLISASNEKSLYDNTYTDSLTWCACVIEIEIDPVTLEIICKNIWLTMEAGTILEPEKSRLHVEKEIIKGLRSVSFKQAFTDHKYLPRQHLPVISLNFLEKPYKHGPLGAKGIGELPSLCIAPAYVSAVSQAIGINITSFPLIPENMREYMVKNED